MTEEEQITAHWPIFEHWYKETYHCLVLPSGKLLVIGWYAYCEAWTNLVAELRKKQ